MTRMIQSRAAICALLGVATAALVLSLRSLGLLEALELAEYDRLRAFLLPIVESGGPTRTVVVGYSERDLSGEIGFPLSDDLMATGLEAILADGPRGVGVDFFRDISVPPGTERLLELLQRDPRVVMVHQLATHEDDAVAPPASIDRNQAGLADLALDDDGNVRRAILYLDDPDYGTALSLPLQLSLRYLSQDGIGLSAAATDEPQLLIGDTLIPRFAASDGGYVRADDDGYQLLIDYRDRAPSIALDLTDVIRGDFEPGLFRDKLVFFGATAHTHTDLRSTPFGDWPGIFIHAQIAEQLIRLAYGESAPIRTFSGPVEMLWVLLWALIGSVIGLWRPPLAVSAAMVVATTSVLSACVVGASYYGWWIPGVPAILANLATSAVVTAYLSRQDFLERNQLMLLFSRHMSKRLADSIWEHREEFVHGGRPRPQQITATILFLDMKGFTEVAEKLDTLKLMEWLNDFMATMAREAERYGGLVDDYFGDGMKVDFGVPIPSTTEEQINADAEAAVRCGLAMADELERLNQDWASRNLPQCGMRIGIATGPAVAGSFGEKDRLKFTVVGDTVNTAARLESLKSEEIDFGPQRCRLLIADETLSRIGESFESIDRGLFSVKGKSQSIRVHQIVRRGIESSEPAMGGS